MNSDNKNPIFSIDNDVYNQVGTKLNNQYSMNNTISSVLEDASSEVVKTTPSYVDPVKQLKEMNAQMIEQVPSVDSAIEVEQPTDQPEAQPIVQPEGQPEIQPTDVYSIDQPPAELSSTPTMFEFQNNDFAAEVDNNYDVDGPIITSYNATNIINNYNHVDNIPVDDEYFSTVEEQLANSKDINLYTQQPKSQADINALEAELNASIPTAGPQYTTSQPVQQPVPTVQPTVTPVPVIPAYTQNDSSRPDYSNNFYSNPAFTNSPSQQAANNYIPKSEFASRPGEEETNVDKKIKKTNRKFKFLLFLIYVIIIGVVGFAGYSYYIKTNDFYLGKTDLTIAAGSSYSEKIYRKGITENIDNYEFSSSDTKVVIVNDSGKITGVSEGNATVTVKNKKTKKAKTVSVKVIDLVITDFKTDTDERVVYMGNNFTITPLINNQSNIVLDLVWTSSDESIALVTNTGVVQPVKPGNVQITVSVPNTEYSAVVNIIVAKN